MAEALQAGFDLGVIAGCFVLIALLAIVAYTFERLASVLDVKIGPWHPFHGVANAIRSSVVDGCNDGIKALEKAAARFEHGLAESLYLLLGLPLLALLGVKLALEYLWSRVLVPRLHAIEHRLAQLEHGITSAPGSILHAAEAYADGLFKTAEHDFTRGIDRLRTKVEGELAKGIDDVKGTAMAAIDKLAGAERKALGAVESALGATTEELHDLEKQLPLTDIAAVIAAVPLLAALVHVLEAETGLGNAECRGKVKQICGTNPAAWEQMLLGLAALGFAISLPELVKVARPMFGELEHLIAQAA